MPTRASFDLIQVLRGYAACQVVLYHLTLHAQQNMPRAFLGDAFHFGNFGVDVFFIGSGFIIFFSTARDFGRPSELAAYLARRFNRIFPPYWLALLGCILLELRFADADLSITRVLLSAVAGLQLALADRGRVLEPVLRTHFLPRRRLPAVGEARRRPGPARLMGLHCGRQPRPWPASTDVAVLVGR